MLDFLENEVDPILAEFEIGLYKIRSQKDYDAFLDYRDKLLSRQDLTEHQLEGIRKMSGSLAMMDFKSAETNDLHN